MNPPSRWIAGQELRLAFTVVGERNPIAWNWSRRSAGHLRRTSRGAAARTRATSTAPCCRRSVGGRMRCSIAWRSQAEVTLRRLPPGRQRIPQDGGWRIAVLPPDAPAVIFAGGARSRAHPGAASPVSGRDWSRRPSRVVRHCRSPCRTVRPAPSACPFGTKSTTNWIRGARSLADRRTLRVRARALEPTTRAGRIRPAGTRRCRLGNECADVHAVAGGARPAEFLAVLPPLGRYCRRAAVGMAIDCTRRTWPAVSVCFGAWLYPDHVAEPHTIEIERISVE